MCKKEKEMWFLKFEMTLDSFDPNDEISVEDAQAEMSRNWQKYVDAGCDLSKIVEMMSPADLFGNYDVLVSKGAKIDVADLADDLYTSNGEAIFMENPGWFLTRGLDSSDLMNRLEADCVCDFFCKNCRELVEHSANKDYLKKAFINNLEESCCSRFELGEIQLCIANEIDKDFLVDVIVGYISAGLDRRGGRGYYVYHLLEVCEELCKYGISLERIKELFGVVASRDGYVVYELVFGADKCWAKFGIKAEDYVVPFVRYLAENCDCEYSYTSGGSYWNIDPNWSDEFRKHVGKEILKQMSTAKMVNGQEDIEAVVDNLTLAISPKELGKKYIEETQCDPTKIDVWYVTELLKRDGSFDPEKKLLDAALKAESETGEEGSIYYDDFLELGVDESELARLGITKY